MLVVISTKVKKRREEPVAEEDAGCYGQYHVDIWFLLAEFIEPVDIGRFAGICSTSHYVVHTVKFWVNLYQR